MAERKQNILRCFRGAARERDQWRVRIFQLSKVRHLLSSCRRVCWHTHMKRNGVMDNVGPSFFTFKFKVTVANGSNIYAKCTLCIQRPNG